MSEWQPIETAPHDDWIMVYAERPYIARHFHDACPEHLVEEFETLWVISLKDVGDGERVAVNCLLHEPTHWQPLPESP